MKQQFEKLEQEMSELIRILLEAKTTSLLLIGIGGWAVCPLIAITGLLTKLYFRFKN